MVDCGLHEFVDHVDLVVALVLDVSRLTWLLCGLCVWMTWVWIIPAAGYPSHFQVLAPRVS